MKKYSKVNHIPACVCLPQLTVQESSWTVSFASSTKWCSCYPTPAGESPITAAPTTNKSSQQGSLHPAVTMISGLTWTVVCSLPAMMQMTAWSWLWRFLNYATTNRKSVVITIRNWFDDQKSDCSVWTRCLKAKHKEMQKEIVIHNIYDQNNMYIIHLCMHVTLCLCLQMYL